jgi:hypothetical protein
MIGSHSKCSTGYKRSIEAEWRSVVAGFADGRVDVCLDALSCFDETLRIRLLRKSSVESISVLRVSVSTLVSSLRIFKGDASEGFVFVPSVLSDASRSVLLDAGFVAPSSYGRDSYSFGDDSSARDESLLVLLSVECASDSQIRRGWNRFVASFLFASSRVQVVRSLKPAILLLVLSLVSGAALFSVVSIYQSHESESSVSSVWPGTTRDASIVESALMYTSPDRGVASVSGYLDGYVLAGWKDGSRVLVDTSQMTLVASGSSCPEVLLPSSVAESMRRLEWICD